MPGSLPARRRGAITLIASGAVLLAVTAAGVAATRTSDPVTAAPPPVARSTAGTLARAITTAQAKLRAQPQDPLTWAQLGSAYVEQARITVDPSYYPKAEGALRTSLRQQPDVNAAALIGMGALANARHDFAAARDWGRKAVAVAPDTAEAYGVLADAYTQLGDALAATGAVQDMLDHKPGVSSFTRASYDLEQHGRLPEAADALQRALQDSTDPSDLTFCRYYLGELAFNYGKTRDAATQYDLGLAVRPDDPTLLEGRAKAAAALGRTDQAVADYQQVVSRVPLPQYLLEYAQLLTSLGRTDRASQQYEILDAQQKLFAANGVTDDLTASLAAVDRGDHATALTAAQREWGRRHSVLVADALAWALHLNGRDKDALTYADKAAATGWPNATFAFHRGMILAALGRTTQARDALTDALHTNPYFSPIAAPQARKELAALGGGR